MDRILHAVCYIRLLTQDTVSGFTCFDLEVNSLLGLAVILVSNPGLYENFVCIFCFFSNCKNDKLEKHDPSGNKWSENVNL